MYHLLESFPITSNPVWITLKFLCLVCPHLIIYCWLNLFWRKSITLTARNWQTKIYISLNSSTFWLINPRFQSAVISSDSFFADIFIPRPRHLHILSRRVPLSIPLQWQLLHTVMTHFEFVSNAEVIQITNHAQTCGRWNIIVSNIFLVCDALCCCTAKDNNLLI